MNRITPLLVVAVAAITGSSSVNAQETTTAAETTPTMCSCSPTSFTFTLSLSQSCSNNTIEDNAGIDGSYCFTEEGVAIPAPPAVVDEEEEATTEDEDEEVTMTTSAIIETRDYSLGYAYYGTHEDGPVRHLQDADADVTDKVVEIVSVQFLEFDTSGDLTVINQDDTYADVSLSDGDRLKFNSASSFLDTSLLLEDQMSSPALVPGGASLILYGKTESGVVVRNRFFWMYDMNCGEENDPIQVDDTIGWIAVAETSNAWPTFCPALPEGSPTIAPRSNEPTLTPSKSPTLKPSSSPGMSMSMEQHVWGGDGHVIPTDTTVDHGDSSWGGGAIHSAFGSKSSKQAKTVKPSKAAKSSSKSGKSAKGSKKDHWGGAYQEQKVTGYDVSSSSVVKSGLALVVSFLLAFIC